MTYQQMIVGAIISLAVVLFFSNWLRFDLVAIIILTLLVVPSLFGDEFEVLPPEEALLGFSSEAVMVLACLFILTRGLQRTGLSDSVASLLQRLSGRSDNRIFLILLCLVGILSAMVNNTAVTAMAIPIVVRCFDRLSLSPNRVYLPLAYMSLVGGVMTLIGTSTNLAVSGELVRMNERPIGMFEMLPAGAVFTVATGVCLYFLSPFFLRGEPKESLFKKYNVKEFVSEILVKSDSRIVGQPLQDLHFGRDYDLTIVGVVRGEKTLFSPPPTLSIRDGDVLMVQGGVENIISLRKDARLELLNELKVEEGTLRSIDLVMGEVVLLPNSGFIGRTIRDSDLRDTYGVTILALARGGLKLVSNLADIPLQMGDTLLIQGHPGGIDRVRRQPNVLVLETIERPLIPRRLPIALAILVTFVIAGAMPGAILYLNCLLAVLALLLTRCVSLKDVYESIDWRLLVLIGGLLPLGKAVTECQILDHVTPYLPQDHPYLLLAAVYLVTFGMTQVISNTAAAVLMTPVALQVANSMSLQSRPFVMAVAFAASFAFMTPVAHQSCTLVMGPGNYTFRDYFRLGSLLGLVMFLLSLWVIPFFFPLS